VKRGYEGSALAAGLQALASCGMARFLVVGAAWEPGVVRAIDDERDR
jgi:hypothetical protein